MEYNIIQQLKPLALLLSMLGSILICSSYKHKRKIGFCCWLISNLIWLNNAFILNDFYQIILWVFYLITSIVGIIKNSKK
jgi:uncharacterized membrane protein YhhN